MTQEDKQLLLKDLCARLPYGVILHVEDDSGNIIDEELNSIDLLFNEINVEYHLSTDVILPYLRPMSSMTEAELDECVEYSGIRELECPQIETFEDRLLWSIKMFGTDYKSIDWLNAHYFDYRGLIEKWLALEAPEGMYKQ